MNRVRNSYGKAGAAMAALLPAAQTLLPAVLLPAVLLLTACGGSDAPADDSGGWTSKASGEVVYVVTAPDGASTRSGGQPVSVDNFVVDGNTFRVWAWMTDASVSPQTYSHMVSQYNRNELFDLPVYYSVRNTEWATVRTLGQFYWPASNYRVDFYAVYPSSGTTFAISETTSRFDYSSTAVTGGDDVLYAIYSGTGDDDLDVTLNFQHIFSQVQFLASADANLTVTVTSVELANVYSRGVFMVGEAGNGPTEAWQSLTTPATYAVSLKSDAVVLTTTAQELGTSSEVLMLIPQSRSAWDRSTTTIAANDAGAAGCYLKVGCSVVMNGYDFVTGGYVYVPLSPNWTRGNNYVYTLHFGGGYDATGSPYIQIADLEAAIQPWNSTTVESTATH